MPKEKQTSLPLHYRDPDKIHIFTDGSSSTKDRTGGWGAYVVWGDKELRVSGWQEDTGIGAMELTGILEGLRCVRSPTMPVMVHTDSEYCVNALVHWWPGWEADGWMTSSCKPVKNLELIQEILALIAGRPVGFAHIKGHNGFYGNEQADRLAGRARRELVSVNKLREIIMETRNRTRPKPKTVEQKAKHEQVLAQWTDIAKTFLDTLHIKRDSSDGWAAVHPLKAWSIYIITSHMYYAQDISLIPDSWYDQLCRHLLSLGREHLAEHGAWYLDKYWDESALTAGTGYHLSNDIPVALLNIGDALHLLLGLNTYRAAENQYKASDDDTPMVPKPQVRTRARPQPTPAPVRTRTRPAPTTAPVRVRVRPK